MVLGILKQTSTSAGTSFRFMCQPSIVLNFFRYDLLTSLKTTVSFRIVDPDVQTAWLYQRNRLIYEDLPPFPLGWLTLYLYYS